MTEGIDVNQIKDVVSIASPFIKSMVDTFVTPKLLSLKNRFNLDYKKYHVPTEEHFSEYLHRTYKRLSFVNMMVFNNSQRLLKEIYLPLTIVDNNKKKRTKIDKYPQDILNKYERILITDTAGMGKSTIMKRMFLDVVDNNIEIPILIELRRLSKGKTIIQEIHEQLNSFEKEFDNNLLLEFIKDGGFVFFFDGYDEISLQERQIVTYNIQSFVSKAPKNKYIITSRPENALSCFGEFQEFKIEPLKKKEAFELLRKYDKQGQVSTLLIQKLEEKEMKNIEEYFTNPLLVTLLFTAFQYKQTIPFKKYLFYRQVYDANFESHDLTKGDSFSHKKNTKLEIDDFHRVLRHIGFSCLRNNQKIEFNKDEILNLISQARRYCVGLNFTDSDFLKDLLSTVPLFTKDGVYYKWTHKSLYEYFAAQFIYLDSKDKQSHILRQLCNNSNTIYFLNVLDLYYDIDPKTFRDVVVKDLLVFFRNYVNTTFVDHGNLLESEVILRKEICFLHKLYLYIIKPSGCELIVNENKLNHMISKLGPVQGIINSPNIDNELLCLHKSDMRNILIRLFYTKGLPFVFLINDHKLNNGKSRVKHCFNYEYDPVEITDELTNPFNSIENFNEVNKLIIMSKLDPYRIDTVAALSFLNQIEEDMKLEADENYLLDGI